MALLHSFINVRPHHVRRQLQGYVGRLRWVAMDGWKMFRGRALLITVVNFIGMTTAASCLGGIVLYAKHAGDNKPLHLFHFKMHLDGSLTMLLAYGAGLAVLGIFSGASLYYMEW